MTTEKGCFARCILEKRPQSDGSDDWQVSPPEAADGAQEEGEGELAAWVAPPLEAEGELYTPGCLGLPQLAEVGGGPIPAPAFVALE